MNTEQKNDQVSSEVKKDKFYLDYSLKTCEERMEFVKELLNKFPEKTKSQTFINNLSDYVINGISKQEKKEKKILTDNRLVTINKRETSFEGVIEKLEFDDCIYSMIDENKQTILTPSYTITKKDIEEIPLLQQLVEEIKKVEELSRHAIGIKKYSFNKWLIEMRRDQYIIKDGYKKPQKFKKITHSPLDIETKKTDEHIFISENGRVTSDEDISLFNPQHVSLLLHYYSRLKEQAWGHFENELWYLMEDLDNLVEKALPENQPMLYDILIMKIDGLTNIEINEEIYKNYGKKYTNEYLSSLWRKKIPKLVAEAAEQDYLEWYYTVIEKGNWKKCSRCGQIKLAHNFYFSKNKSSKDGFYSICKCCRNAKNKIKKIEGEQK